MKVAAIDMGSNAIRLALATVDKNGHYFIFDKVRIPLRLGAEAFGQGYFSDETIEQVVDVFKSFRERLDLDGVDNYRAVATSAYRNAQNSDQLVRLIDKKANIKVESIEGDIEAQFIRQGVERRMALGEKDWLLVDIGGGSMELSIYFRGVYQASKSFPLGTVRLLQQAKNQNSLIKIIDDAALSLSSFLNPYSKNIKHFRIVGTGGNFRRILKVKRKIILEGRGDRLYPDEIELIMNNLQALGLEERASRFGLRSDAADVIIPALALIKKICDLSKIKKIYAPDIGLIDALLYELCPK